MGIIVAAYLLVLILSIISILSAAYALAIQLFIGSCVLLVGIIIAKHIKASALNEADPMQDAYNRDQYRRWFLASPNRGGLFMKGLAMTIRKFLDISTAHIPPETMATLLNTEPGNAAISGYGIFLYVPSSDTLSEFSRLRGVPDIFSYARSVDCDYAYLDQDAETIPSLPDYSDEWERWAMKTIKADRIRELLPVVEALKNLRAAWHIASANCFAAKHNDPANLDERLRYILAEAEEDLFNHVSAIAEDYGLYFQYDFIQQAYVLKNEE